jgi:cytochrome d ubiquinol oxidase subunit I
MEGLWETGRGVPASLLGWPDEQGERNIAEIAIPKLGSLYLTHSWDGEVKGLKDFPRDERPPVAVVYFAFRLMVGLSILMLAVIAWGFVLLWRGKLDTTRWYLQACQFMAASGFIAVIAGWTTAEVGRQPWTIYGLLRTAESVSPSLSGANVLTSLLLYIAVYLVVYPIGLFVMLRVVWQGPVRSDIEAPVASGHPKAPIEALANDAGSKS